MKINTDLLTSITGDPFADIGGLVIKHLWSKPEFHDKDILSLIDYVTKIYVNNWNAKLNAFFLNSKITQPAFVGERKIEEANKYYKALVEETLPHKEGYCRISGQHTKLFVAGRDNHILSGSGTFLNFHSHFEPGLYLSKEMLIRMFFVPLGVIQLSDKVALLSSSSEKVTALFVNRNVDDNLNSLARKTSEGILRSPFSFPANAIFEFIDYYLKGISTDVDNLFEETNASITLYHFTNFGASPDAVIYELDSKVFQFYSYSKSESRNIEGDPWRKLLRSNYRSYKQKGTEFDPSTEEWKSKTEKFDYNEYRLWRNPVIEKLLKNQSILSHIAQWIATKPFPSAIIDIYLTYVRNMDKRTINIIRKIADFIVDDQSEETIAKTVKQLKNHRSAYELRQYIVRQVELNYERNANQVPLVSLEDYAFYLFPEGSFWRETKNLLLICIFERLHALGKTIDAIIDDDEEKDVEEEINELDN